MSADRGIKHENFGWTDVGLEDSWLNFTTAIKWGYPDARLKAVPLPKFGTGQYDTAIWALLRRRLTLLAYPRPPSDPGSDDGGQDAAASLGR